MRSNIGTRSISEATTTFRLMPKSSAKAARAPHLYYHRMDHPDHRVENNAPQTSRSRATLFDPR
eukprot:10859262-Heterocapsa_arctica.AAC.1